MIPSVDIFEAFLASIVYSSDVRDLTDNGDGTFTFQTCKTLHGRVGSTITIGGNDYIVTSFANNVSITITAASAPVGSTFTIDPPFYFHDVPTTQNTTMQNLPKELKYPLIWFREVVSDLFDNDPASSIERTSSVRLYLMDNSNYQDWNTDEHYQHITNPMLNLFEEIKAKINRYANFNKPDSFNVTYHNRFGVYSDLDGHTSHFFDDNLSGLEIIFDLPIKNSLLCNRNNICN